MKTNWLIICCLWVVTALGAQNKETDYGVCLMDGEKSIGCHENRYYAMHSVMKFPQALYVVEHLRRNGLTLNDSVLVNKAELEPDTWSPMLHDWEGERYFTYAQLLAYSLGQSDNNACDLLFRHCGAPASVEQYIRSIGFPQIHIRLTEREMHRHPDRAIENCCTPGEMARLFEWFYHRLSEHDYYGHLASLMEQSRTGTERVLAVIPRNGRFIHKTGSGFPCSNGTQDRNDAGILLLPDGSHVVIAVFAPASQAESDVAEIARQYLRR